MIIYHGINEKPKKQKEVVDDMKNYSNELLKLINISKTYDQLLEVTYTRGGGMENHLDRRTLDVNGLTYKVENNGTQIYKVSKSQIEELIKMIEKYNFPMWKSIPRSDIQALDAEITTITFTYNNKAIGGEENAWYSISDDQELPKEAKEKLQEFKQKLFALDQIENKID